MSNKKLTGTLIPKDNKKAKMHATFYSDKPIGSDSDSEIFNEYVDATDQQRNIALANVSNQTANSTTGKMGYKILNPTQSFASQVTDTNTIYEIRDVFDLGGTEESPISIPANSTLKFNGGKLDNGYLTTNSCIVESQGLCFGRNVEFNGTFGNSTIYTKWFDFISADDEWIIDGSDISRNANCTDNLIPFKQVQSLIDDGKTIEFSPNQYLQSSIKSKVTSTGNLANEANTILYISNKKDVTINLNGSTIKMLYTNSIKYDVIKIVKSSVEIFGGILIGCAKYYNYPDHNTESDIFGGEIPEPTANNDYEWHWGIEINGGYLNLHDVDLSYYCGSALMLGGYSVYSGTQDDYVPVSYIVKDVNISYCGRGALGCLSCIEGNFDNININMIGMPAVTSGVMPRNPRVAIGLEFEDLYLSNSRYLLNPYPRFTFNNINVSNVYKIAGVSKGYSANDVYQLLGMKQLSFTNSKLSGHTIELNNLPYNVCNFTNCVIDVTQTNTFQSSVFTNCLFRFNATVSQEQRPFGSKCFNCIFEDYIEEGYSTYNRVLLTKSSTASYKPYFEGCKISFHVSDLPGTYINSIVDISDGYSKSQNTIIKNSTITGVVLYASYLTIYNSIIDCQVGIAEIEGIKVTAYYTTFSKSIYLKDTNKSGSVFKNCTFDGINYTSMANVESTMIGCSGTIKPYQYGVLNIINSNLSFESLSTNISPLNFKPFNIKNSIIDVQASLTSVGVITSYTPTITAINSSISIPDNYYSKQTTLINCIINSTKSRWTEIAFEGTQKDCSFSTPIPTHGDSSTRPTASSMPNTYAGFTYFDETLGMPLYLKVDVDTTDPDNPVYTKSWVKADGTALS